MVCLLAISVLAKRHPLHVTTVEVNFDPKDRALEVSCKIFSDDFEKILAKLYKQKIDLGDAKIKTKMNDLVKKYFATHLKLKHNGAPSKINFVGFEQDHEATNVYLEVKNVTLLKSIEVSNSLLYDLYNDQMSIIHLVKGLDRKSKQVLYPEQKFGATF